MNTQMYKPEGLMAAGEVRETYYSEASLEKAAATGKILEARAVLCDSDFSLHVELGSMKGIIKKEEAVYHPTGEEVRDIAVITRVGKTVAFKVIGFDKKDGETIAILSRREAQRDCLENFLFQLIAGDVIDARVTHLEPFGAFVDVGCGIVSLLSIDCISVSRISHPRDRFYTGMPIKTIVKSIDHENARIYVTHKELLGTWKENIARFEIGQTVSGIIRSIEPYGIFVELAPNLAGLCEYREGVSVGQKATVYIKNIIPEKMKVKLVLVDAFCGGETAVPHFTYSDVGSHLASWRYSPEESERIVESIFAEEL